MKTDLKRTISTYTAPRGQFEVVTVPPMRYLAVDGSGDPNTARSYREALETLYPVAYRMKFRSKDELERDYVVPPLEALWWADDMAAFTTDRDKSAWYWSAMILVPEWIPNALIDAACEDAAAKAPALDRLRLRGRHHEIYLSDPRRAAPERLRTILRQPVERAVV